jgi:hypothetical protein
LADEEKWSKETCLMITADRYEIKIPPRRSYKHSVQDTWLLTFFLSVIPVIVIPFVFGVWQFTLAAGALCVWFALDALRPKKYYISYLRITKEQVEIRYMEKDKEKYTVDRPEYFTFRVQQASRKGINYKLVVHYNGKLILQQYPLTGHWTEQMLVETSLFFNHRLNV